MATIDERIENTQKEIEENRKLYEEGRRRYENAKALYEQAKAAAIQAKSYSDVLKNKQLSADAALAAAASLAPDPATFNQQTSQSGTNPEQIRQNLSNEATNKLKVAEEKKKKAEKEVQQTVKFLEAVQTKIGELTRRVGNIFRKRELKQTVEKSERRSDVIVNQDIKKIKINDARAIAKKNSSAIRSLAKAAALFIISKLLNKLVQRLSKTVQRLTDLVDRVNEQILNIQTKQDVLRARVVRNAALVELNKAERQITQIRNIIRTLERILRIISLVLRVLLLIPVPASPGTVQKITNAIMTLDSITVMLGITKEALNGLIIEVQYQRSRLLPISDIIDKAIDNDLSPDEINALVTAQLAGGGQLGVIPNVSYKGFTFAIYEENDPRFVVDGNKRRYAVALDRSGFIVLRTEPSFTLNPDVLVENLKLQIDERNLEA
jgi:uncharacterized protein Yka (UPF0111/DUF47 family)